MIGRFSPDDRAVTPAVSHVLTISITSLLVIGLLATAGGFLTDEERASARQELDAIGNRLADEVSRVDTLANDGGQSWIVTNHPPEVTGGGYSVEQSSCPQATDCLFLESHDLDVTARVPLQHENGVTVRTVSSGTFNITATNTGSNPSVGERDASGLDLRVGIGSDIEEDPLGTRLTTGNEEPFPRFDVEPTPVTTGFTHVLNGSRSVDPDGNVTEHKWDVGNDGLYTRVGEISPHWFDEPGRQEVTLRVADDADETASATLTKNVTVSGIEYNEDLREGAGNASIRYSFHNNWSHPVRINSLLIDDLDDSIDRFGDCDDDPSWSEINIDVDSDGTRDTYVEYDDGNGGSCTDRQEIPDPGKIIDIDQAIDDADTTAPATVPRIPPGEDVTIEIVGLGTNQDVDRTDTSWRLGLTTVADGRAAETVFEDTVGAPHIQDFSVDAVGSDVSIRVESDRELDRLDVTWRGPATGPTSISRGDFTETSINPYVYRADVASVRSGLFSAELDDARDGLASAHDTAHRDTVVGTDDADPVWEVIADWDGNGPESGVVHDAFGDRSPQDVTLGHTRTDRHGSNLTAYWPMDGDGGTMDDVTANGNDGTTNDVFDETVGLFGTTSFAFTSDTSRVDGIASTDRLSGGENQNITVSTWIHPRQSLTNSDRSAIVGKLNATTGGDWGLVVNSTCAPYAHGGCDGLPAVGYYGGNGTHEYALMHGPVTKADTWHHVAFVYDGNNDNLDLYFDGDPVESDGDTPDFVSANTTRDVVVGEHPRTGENFDGYIDETRVYNRTLTGGEVQSLYDASRTGSFVTAWDNTSAALDVTNLNLSSSVDTNGGNVTVTVVTGAGERSQPIDLEDGASTQTVTGLSTDTDGYRLEVRIESQSPNRSPVVDTLVVHESP